MTPSSDGQQGTAAIDPEQDGLPYPARSEIRTWDDVDQFMLDRYATKDSDAPLRRIPPEATQDDAGRRTGGVSE